MNLELYTTGGGDFLLQIFNYLAAYTSSGNFANLMWIGIMAGSIMAALKLVYGGGIKDVITQFIIVAVVGSAFLGPRATVIIFDKTKAGNLPYAAVANVPFGIAFIGNVTSSVSYYVTRHMEALLSTPTNLRYQDTGMVFGASLLSQTARWTAVDSILHRNLVSFLQNCIIDGVNLGHVDLDLVANSGDLINDLGPVLPNSLSYYDVMTSATQDCQAGWPTIVTNVNNEVDAVLAQKAAATYQGNSLGAAQNITRLQNTLGDFQNMIGMSSATAVESIRQAMLVNAFDGSVSEFIALSGNSAAMSHYQAARAEAQTQASYISTGAAATKWVPYLKIVFECLFYAAFPMAVFMMMTPMGLPVMKGYFGGFVWLAAWEPLNAILHSIVLQAAAGFYRAAGMVSSNGAVNDVVLSWANHFGVQAVESDVGAVAGYLMMSVPFLAYAVLFGANRMMGLATSMLAVGQGAAIETGREAATGNLSLGNVSMNNMAANKWNTSSLHDAGRSTRVLDNGAMVHNHADRSTTFSSGTAETTGGLRLNLGKALSREFSERQERSEQVVRTQSSEFSSALSSLANRYSEVANTASLSNSTDSTLSSGFTESQATDVSEAWRNVVRFSERNGLNTNVGLAAMAAANLGTKWTPGLSANVKVDGVSSEEFNRAVESARTSDVQESFRTIQEASERYSRSEGRATGNSASQGNRYGYDEIERRADALSNSIAEADRYATASAAASSASGSVNQSLNNAFANYLRSEGFSDDDIGVILNPKTNAAIHANQPLVDEFMDGAADEFLTQPAFSNPTSGFQTNQGIGVPSPYVPSTTSSLATAARRRDERFVDAHEKASAGILDGLIDLSATTSATQAGEEARIDGKVDEFTVEAVGKRVFNDASETLNAVSGGLLGATPKSETRTPTVAPGFTNSQGVYERDNIRYDNGSAVRNRPVDPSLMMYLSGIAEGYGSDVNIVVTSGGQPPTGSGGTRVGSTRHDVNEHNHGGAVDFYLERGGQRVNPADDPELYASFIQIAAREYPGIGHYDWGLHVGGGEPAFWGPDTTAQTADPYFRSAYDKGRGQ